MALKGNLRDPCGVPCPVPGLLSVSARPVALCDLSRTAALWDLASASTRCSVRVRVDPRSSETNTSQKGHDPMELVPKRGRADTWGHATGNDGQRAACRLEVAPGRCANEGVNVRTARGPGRSLG